MSIGDGWARGGAALAGAMSGGSGGAYGQAYDEAMSRGHTLQKKLAEARIASDKMRQREEADIKLSELAASNPQMAPMIELAGAMTMGGVGNFDQNTRGGMNLTRHETLLGAREAAARGDTATASMLAGLSNQTAKIPDQTKVSGNVFYNPAVAPGAQEAVVTPYGSEYLDNARDYNSDRVAASMLRGSGRASSATAGTPQDAYDDIVKQAASETLSKAKLEGRNVTGISARDVEYALRTNGEFRDRDGNLITKFEITPSGIAGSFDGVESSVKSTAASAMSGAPVAAPEPDRAQNAAATSAVAAAGGKGAAEGVPSGAAELLLARRGDPAVVAQFKAKYGDAAARAILGE